MSDAQFLALLAAVMACIPGRTDTTIDQDIALAQEYLASARTAVPGNTVVVGGSQESQP